MIVMVVGTNNRQQQMTKCPLWLSAVVVVVVDVVVVKSTVSSSMWMCVCLHCVSRQIRLVLVVLVEEEKWHVKTDKSKSARGCNYDTQSVYFYIRTRAHCAGKGKESKAKRVRDMNWPWETVCSRLTALEIVFSALLSHLIPTYVTLFYFTLSSAATENNSQPTCVARWAMGAHRKNRSKVNQQPILHVCSSKYRIAEY